MRRDRPLPSNTPPRTMPFHPYAWLAWVAAAGSAALLTRNPLYLSLILLATLWVQRVVAASQEGLVHWLTRWGWTVIGFAAFFNGLTIHYGETILWRFPADWPLVGGPITLEAITFGFISGLSLVTLLLIFVTFNCASDYADLLRLVPGFLFQVGLATSIALAFVPQTVQAFRDVREAQLIRGHRFRTWRDLPPLLVPLLTNGLERAIQLAEAMESRGFGGSPQRGALRARLVLLLGLVLLLLGMGWYRLVHPFWGISLVLVGVSILLFGLYRLNRRLRRTRYRRYCWQKRDIALLLISSGVLLILWGTALFRPASLAYYPYPRLSMPPFEYWLGGIFSALATPALWDPKWET